ncbi:MAG: hypothetical protein KF762_00005 [Acidobacteria bacterium]|nr:hypothetical protein [Acidobacteriota bacterium]
MAELREFLFNAPRVAASEESDIEALVEKTWASGTNLYHLSIFELAKVVLSIIGEDGRRDFVVKIGEQLNEFNTQPANRLRWKVLLENL